MLRGSTAVLALLIAACALRPPVPQSRTYIETRPVTIEASSDKTQRAISAMLLNHKVVVAGADSGLYLSLDAWSVADRYRFADCGGNTVPHVARITFKWGGDATRSTIELHIMILPSIDVMMAGASRIAKVVECRTTGQLEHDLVAEIRAKAEAL